MARPVLPLYLVHYDRPDWCASAVASVQCSTGVDVRVTVVDNGQRGGPALSDALPPGTRVLRTGRNAGFTGAANLAIADWRSFGGATDLCVIGSHDLHVRPDTLVRLADLARGRPDAGIVAPALVAPATAAGGTWTGRAAKQRPLFGAPEVVDCEWASGTCLMLRRACVEEVGAFDERFGSYVEDVDYGLRARDHGWRVLVLTSAVVWGLGSAGPETDTLALRAANIVLLNAKRGGVRAAMRSAASFGWEILRDFVASCLPWRDRERRRRSRFVAATRLGALARLLFDDRMAGVLRDRRFQDAHSLAAVA